MKKWLYVISVGAMLAAWLAIYFPAKKATEERLAAQQAAIERQKEEDDARRLAIEQKAREDADRRAAERAKEEADKEAAAQKKWDDESAKIQADTDKANADIARLTQQVNALETELDTLHKAKDEDNREDFDLTKQVELARVNQFNAELEIQRMVDMVASRADQSSLTAVQAASGSTAPAYKAFDPTHPVGANSDQ
jgi:flagellar motility protein MotE (MotC chaperone)